MYHLDGDMGVHMHMHVAMHQQRLIVKVAITSI